MSREQDGHEHATQVAIEFAVRIGALQRCTAGDLWHGDELADGEDDEELEELLAHADEDEVEDAGGKQALLAGLRAAIQDATIEKQCSHPAEA